MKAQHQEFEPPEDLRDFIKCFWYEKREYEKSRVEFDVIPDGYAEIIFHIGGFLKILCDGEWQLLPSPFIVGLLNKPVIFSYEGCLEIIGIRCYPWSLFNLLDMSAGKPGVLIINHSIAQLQALLKEKITEGSIKEALNEINQYFNDRRLIQTLIFTR